MQFQWPVALLTLLLIPLLATLYALAQRRRRAYAVRFTNLALLREVAGPRPAARRHIPPLLFLLGIAALCLGVARPVATVAASQRQATVMLVLDVSGSMDTPDLRPSRLEAAKAAARTFVEGMPSDAQVGLVSFSDTARLDAPLSSDHLATLSALTTLKTIGGTAIGDGLSLALEAVEQQPGAKGSPAQRAATIVLLTDGENNEGVSPAQATARAQQDGVRVYTVGVGRPDTGLDENTLRQMAAQTGGAYFSAAAGDDLRRIYGELATRLRTQAQRSELTAFAAGLGGILLLAGALLSLFWLQRFP